MIIDAHAHLINIFSGTTGCGEVVGIGDGKVLKMDGTVTQVIPLKYGDYSFKSDMLIKLMDQASIDKAVLFQAYFYGIDNDYCFETVKKYPERFIGVGSFDPYIIEQKKVLDRLVEVYGFKILKFEISDSAGLCGFHPDYKINSNIMEPIYQRATKDDLVIVFDIGQQGMRSFQIDNLITITKTYPTVDFVLCHLLAPKSDTEFGQWKRNIRKLAKCNNLYFDIAALSWNLNDIYPYNLSVKYLAMAKEFIGVDKLIWGSDVPITLTLSDYKKQYDYLVESEEFTDHELNKILFENALKLYWR